jgi:hypothetical protein
MKLPFTIQDFLEVFKKYNTALFPVQIILLLLALFTLLLVLRNKGRAGKPVFIILSMFWTWMGAVYHISFFSTINPAAWAFGLAFIAEGLLLLFYGLKKAPVIRFTKDTRGFIAVLLISFALVVYPALGYLAGHVYPYSPTFGLPCPTTIFTFGFFLLTAKRLPIVITLIPILWSVIGFSAALSLGMVEDIGLIIAGLIFIFLNANKLKSHNPTHATVE